MTLLLIEIGWGALKWFGMVAGTIILIKADKAISRWKVRGKSKRKNS